MANNFERWIQELRRDVIKGMYGHQESEYTVCPDAWRWLYERGLTPAEAFRCALDAHSEGQRLVEEQRLTHAELEAGSTVRTGHTLH